MPALARDDFRLACSCSEREGSQKLSVEMTGGMASVLVQAADVRADSGTLVENEQKGKSVRKALCQRSGETFIVFTDTPESFHDFSQALVDLGVDNAIYLVGSEYSYGFTRDLAGEAGQFAERRSRRWKYENYVVWRR